MPSALQRRIRTALEAAADPARAPAMQAYMKSEMPYLGAASAVVKAVCRDVLADYAPAGAAAWRDDVLTIWRDAKHREERYVAIALASHRQAKAFQTLDALPMYEEMIVTGAWWDYVDTLAGRHVGGLLRAYPKEMRRTMLAWSKCPDTWKRRTSIICQLHFKANTDLALLYACIQPSIASKELFLRKATGWALRQVAKHDPDEVVRYVKEHEAELSGLSKREALKHVQA